MSRTFKLESGHTMLEFRFSERDDKEFLSSIFISYTPPNYYEGFSVLGRENIIDFVEVIKAAQGYISTLSCK